MYELRFTAIGDHVVSCSSSQIVLMCTSSFASIASIEREGVACAFCTLLEYFSIC